MGRGKTVYLSCLFGILTNAVVLLSAEKEYIRSCFKVSPSHIYTSSLSPTQQLD